MITLFSSVATGVVCFIVGNLHAKLSEATRAKELNVMIKDNNSKIKDILKDVEIHVDRTTK